jgi:hypothetical protein
MIIRYKTSVFLPQMSEWRGVTITAEAEQVSKGMAVVTRVTEIDGEEPAGYISRTGARRQAYNARWVAQREVGKRKRLSACAILEEEAA